MLGAFALVASGLGDVNYGIYAGTFSLMLILGPIASWGAGQLVVRDVNASHRSVQETLSWVLVLNFAAAIVTVVGLTAASRVVLPQASFGLFALMAVAELIFGRAIVLIRHIGQAVEQLKLSAVVFLTSRLSRLALAAWFFLSGSASLELWAAFHLASNVAGALVGFGVLRSRDVLPRRGRKPDRPEVKDGLLFALAGNAAFVKNDVDKTLLVRLGFEGAAGQYASGYRLVSAVSQPLLALLGASSAAIFREGARDPVAAFALTRKLTTGALIYTAIAGVALWIAAPLSSLILDESFDETASVVRWLSPLPLIAATHHFAGQALVALGQQARTVVYVSITALLNVVANLVLIPEHTWRGAIGATVISECFLTVLLWSTLLASRKRGPVPTRTA